MLANAAGIALNRTGLHAAVELSAAREMAQRVDMCSHVAAERDGIRGRADAAFRHQIAVFLGEPEEKRRMSWKMRHAHEVGLGKVVNLRLADLAEKLFHPPRFSARRRSRLMPAVPHSRLARRDRRPRSSPAAQPVLPLVAGRQIRYGDGNRPAGVVGIFLFDLLRHSQRRSAPPARHPHPARRDRTETGFHPTP